MFRHDLALIGLTPTGLRVARVSGSRTLQVERIPLDPAEWSQTWEKGLRPLELTLSGALAAAGVRPGSRVRVVYTAPETVVEFSSVPLTGPRALQAAALTLRESLPDVESRVRTIHALAREEASEHQGILEPARTHMILAAENVTHAEILGGWVARAGLTLDSLVPTRALLASAAVRDSQRLPPDGAQALVWLDAQSAFIVARSRGRLQFVRSLELGYAQLAEAIVRASLSAGRPIERADAQRLLFTLGVPKRGTIIDQATGLRAEAVLPLMQSILQRYVVETKQTLRFGLPEGELARASVHLTGPGASVPGVGELFASELDWAVTRPDTDNADALSASAQDDDAGELSHAVTAYRASLSLIPPSESGRRLDAACTRAVWVGAAASLCVVGALWYQARERLAVVESRTAALEPRTEAIRVQRELREHAASLSAELSSARAATMQVLPARPDWKAALADLTRVVAAEVELAEVTALPGKDSSSPSVLTIRGTAFPAGTARPADDVLAALLDRLSKSPLVESARMVSTRSEVASGLDVKQFTIAATMRTLPPATPESMRTATAPEGTP